MRPRRASSNPSRASQSLYREPLDLSTLRMDYDPADEGPKAGRPMGLTEAPTFWPTEKQWEDPLEYIQSVAEAGRKHGIVKIIPPKGWKPRFCIDTKRFRFETRKQELNSMEGTTRSNIRFMDKLSKFHRQIGKPLRPPAIDKQPIDLYVLKRSVDTRGGFKAVCRGRLWAEIGGDLGYGSTKSVTTVSSTLKGAYRNYILPYEAYLERAKPGFLRAMGLTENPVASRRNMLNKPEKVEEERVNRTISDIEVIKPETQEGSAHMEDVTPHPSHNALKRKYKETTVRNASTCTENEKEEWLKRESKRHRADKYISLAAAKPTVTSHHVTSTPHAKFAQIHPQPSQHPGENCEVCGRGDDASNMLLCDGCDAGYHISCLDPPLKSIPKYDWFCVQCLVGTSEFGFEAGDEYSLSEFRQKADSFRQEYISKNLPQVPLKNVTENQIEEEFWKVMSNVQGTVEVEYGADIHSTIHGSGFPTVQTHPEDPYSTDPWNLNILPELSLLHLIPDVSGITVPWLYVGMMFSNFCWHNEDHFLYSINYQHFGATKTWYGVPASEAENFERATRNGAPELFETQPDLLFQLATTFNPGHLAEQGVKIYVVDQRPNQFVITFPKAYHAGFNHGVDSLAIHLTTV